MLVKIINVSIVFIKLNGIYADKMELGNIMTITEEPRLNKKRPAEVNTMSWNWDEINFDLKFRCPQGWRCWDGTLIGISSRGTANYEMVPELIITLFRLWHKFEMQVRDWNTCELQYADAGQGQTNGDTMKGILNLECRDACSGPLEELKNGQNPRYTVMIFLERKRVPNALILLWLPRTGVANLSTLGLLAFLCRGINCSRCRLSFHRWEVAPV